MGYTGGHNTHPKHDDVVAGRTGHTLAVQVLYDRRAIRYSQLLNEFWCNIDPTTPNRQFCAIGGQLMVGGETQPHGVGDATGPT